MSTLGRDSPTCRSRSTPTRSRRCSASVSSDFERLTTVIHMRGGGEEGVGEDVIYDAVDHEVAAGRRARRTTSPGSYTLGEFCERIGGARPVPASRRSASVSRLYRRWALRDGGARPRAAPGRPLAARGARARAAARDVRRLAAARRAADARAAAQRGWSATRRCASSSTRRARWNDAADRRAASPPGAVDSVDFKGLYTGTVVDQPPDPVLYRRVVEAFPDAWIEDPDADARDRRGARAAPRPDHLGRADPLDRRHRGAAVPAADGQHQAVAVRRPAQRCCDAYDYCAERGIGAYGGGQFELGAGRGQIQYLASLFHPDTPNDVAPTRLQRARRRRRACRRARSRRRRRRPASAGADATSVALRGFAGIAANALTRATRSRRSTRRRKDCLAPAAVHTRSGSWHATRQQLPPRFSARRSRSSAHALARRRRRRHLAGQPRAAPPVAAAPANKGRATPSAARASVRITSVSCVPDERAAATRIRSQRAARCCCRQRPGRRDDRSPSREPRARASHATRPSRTCARPARG